MAGLARFELADGPFVAVAAYNASPIQIHVRRGLCCWCAAADETITTAGRAP
jgi:hypothetical protein